MTVAIAMWSLILAIAYFFPGLQYVRQLAHDEALKK